MKKKISIALLFITVLTTGTTQAQQNVGIGTTTPISKLHVRTASDSLILLENTQALGAGISNRIHFKTNSLYTGIIKTIGESTTAARLGFYTGANATSTGMPERLSILNNGFVGIGTTAPLSTLAVSGPATTPDIPGSTSSGIFRISSQVGDGILFGKSLGAPYSGWVQSGHNSTIADPFVINPLAGNVGIGTLDPKTKLQVGDYNNTPNDTYITIKTLGGSQYKAGLGLYHYSDNYGWLLESDETNGSFSLRHRNSSFAPNHPVLTANALDNIGIGTTAYNDARCIIEGSSWHNYVLRVLGNEANVAALSIYGKSLFSDNPSAALVTNNNAVVQVQAIDKSYGIHIDGINASNAALAVNGKSIFSVLNKQLVVSGEASGGVTNNLASYPLLIQGGQQGIAVQINSAAAHAGNNYMFFADNSYVRGSIAGQNYAELQASSEYLWFQSMSTAAVAFILAELAACAVQLDGFEVGVMTVQAITAAVDWGQQSINMQESVGVVFQSGSADYAEWLERADINEDLSPGMIVGVYGGRVSKRTSEAKQLMVVSTAPMVLGNTPPEGRAHAFEKVAFMGQVPVWVAGNVDIGDYILVSGENDGTGVAVPPTKMRLEDYDKVVGVAWSASKSTIGKSLIKAAVGLNTHDLVGEIKKQKSEVQQLRETLQGVMDYMKQKDPEFKLSMPHSQNSYVATNNQALPPQPQSMHPKNSFSTTELKDVYDLLRKNLELVDKVLNEAKEICISRGMDVEFAKGFFDRKVFFQQLEKAIAYKIAPQKANVPVKAEQILKWVQPMNEKK